MEEVAKDMGLRKSRRGHELDLILRTADASVVNDVGVNLAGGRGGGVEMSSGSIPLV